MRISNRLAKPEIIPASVLCLARLILAPCAFIVPFTFVYASGLEVLAKGYACYASLLLAILAFVVAFALPRVWTVYIAFLMVTPVILTSYSAEAYLALRSIFNRARSASGIGVRSKLMVLEDARARGRDSWPAFSPGLLLRTEFSADSHWPILIDGKRVLPLAGVPDTETVFCNDNDSGQWVTFHSDELGFRNPKGIWANEQVDIVLLGDSFAEGQCVADGGTIADRLRLVYPSTLSLGMSGNGPLLSLAIAREYLRDIKPRVVFWCYYENDLYELSDENRNPLLIRYLTDDTFQQGLSKIYQELKPQLKLYLSMLEIPEQEKARYIATTNTFVRRIGNFLAISRLRMFFNGVLAASETMPDADTQTLGRALTEAKQTVESWGGELCLVYLPSAEHYSLARKSVAVLRFGAEHRADVLAKIRESGIPIIDMHPVWLEYPRGPAALFGGKYRYHYNERGYALVSDAMLGYLRTKHFAKY